MNEENTTTSDKPTDATGVESSVLLGKYAEGSDEFSERDDSLGFAIIKRESEELNFAGFVGRKPKWTASSLHSMCIELKDTQGVMKIIMETQNRIWGVVYPLPNAEGMGRGEDGPNQPGN